MNATGFMVDHQNGIITAPVQDSSTADPAANYVTIRVNASGQIVLRDSSGTDYTFSAGSSGPYVIETQAGEWDYPAANPAPLDRDTGTNGSLLRQLFDDTTEEFVQRVFQVPTGATGTVTFTAIGYSATAAASKNVALTFHHHAIAAGESWDGEYATVASGDKATNADQDELDVFTWTETISNLGWAAGDLVRMKVSRTATSGTNLSGDWGLVLFVISIPRS